MQVNAIQSGVSSLISSAASRTNSASDFQAALDAAKQSLIQNNGSGAAVNSSASVAPTQKSAAQELAEYESKSVAQHMRDAILQEMGLSEEELDAMPPEQRAAVEEKIAERMQEKLLAQADSAQGSVAQGSAALLSMLTQGAAVAGALSGATSLASLLAS